MKTTTGGDTGHMAEDRLIFYKDLREARRRQISRRRQRIIALAAAFIVALLLFVNWDNFVPPEATEAIQNFFTNSSANHFPISLSSGDFKGAAAMGGNLGVLTDTSFFLYSSAGTQLVWRQHGMNDPQISAAGGRALLYDRGGKQYRVERRFDEPVSANAASPIVSGEMGASGNFALATESNAYLGELIVYDAQGKTIFHWYDTAGRILAAALSPDGSSVAAIEIGAQNGSISSTVVVFRLDSTKPIAKKQVDGTLLFSIQYNSNGRITAVGDNQALYFDGSGKQTGAYPYGTKQLACYSNQDGSTVLVFDHYENQTAASLLVPLVAGDKLLSAKSVSINGRIDSVYAGSSGITCLSPGMIWRGDQSGNPLATISANGDKLAAVMQSNVCFVFGSQSILRYPLKK
ncbi:DUF5711 family protein [Ethanoligenens harbinense]|uniref:WD40 repeat domain-containing protein n=1 Tax=Ethanoligenens harbinense (strain DSM 18485 / JCM 12961 / CGMCC 1.5033 / YUAN-3) TaxID=663278 RepID=E6U472_ETHHY|nr:DUF5711 family protein [Ethanoligenens harbinense]ADU26572.1 hypothetical protein Ethha_1019 [Ethanoligenens harbinense YUAN-3]AVQ95698.1 hypothetical protein CXQ68_05285 [Ethanoligenens harbinense YUAN-3]AYF38361.1 hypothetical protein CXP51_05145 [Ethanoligenens harbinense]AYF41106.1 hypothetical protein CN246_05275 [Ethanoligenens harbinense]QCN91937.1 hypothetical protein DRA42_05300 [Ethanoligenens harbinense]